MATVTADARGEFAGVGFTVPPGTGAGAVPVTATGAVSGRVATHTLIVTGSGVR